MFSYTLEILRKYQYDALDRLVETTSNSEVGLRLFYCKKRLATEVQGVVRHSVCQQGDLLLAQHRQVGDSTEASLMATDQMRSVLQIVKANIPNPISYSPYGHRPVGSGLLSLLGFNGERADSITGHYFLGNGYRTFNPVLMRFNTPDSVSPFGAGGLNSYVYCLGDPINRNDASGRASLWQGLPDLLNLMNNEISKSVNKLMLKRSAASVPPKTRKLYGRQLDRELSNEQLLADYKLLYKAGNRIKLPVQKINSKRKLMSIPHELGRPSISYFNGNMLGSNTISFIFTESEKLYVGSLGHMALAAKADSSRLISAGEISRSGKKGFVIDNASGHFKPDGESLDAVAEYLEGLGAVVTQVRHTF